MITFTFTCLDRVSWHVPQPVRNIFLVSLLIEADDLLNEHTDEEGKLTFLKTKINAISCEVSIQKPT